MKLSHFFFLILIPVLYSCSSDEHYLDFTIEKQDIKKANALWGRIKKFSGNMDYSINNLNSDIAEAYIYEDGEYGNIVIKPIQKGKATIKITDNICHTSIIIKAEDILNLKYTKLTLLNLLSGDPYVGSLRIILKSSLYQQNEYLVRLKFKDIFKLQPIYRDKIYKQLYPTYF